MLEDASTVDLEKAITANWSASIRTFGLAPQVELYDTPELQWFISGVPSGSMNGVQYSNLPEEKLDATIKEVIVHFNAREVPFGWLTGPCTHPVNTAERLRAFGFQTVAQLEGMALDLRRAVNNPPLPEGLTIEPVNTSESLEEWLTAETVGFEIEEAEIEGFNALRRGMGFGAHLPFLRFLGKLNNVPVATATLVQGGGVAGIYDISVVPDARRQGIGAAITLAALREGQTLGYRYAVLQPTEMGKPLYESLGFRTVCTYQAHAFFS